MTDTARPFGKLDEGKLIDLYKYYEGAGTQARSQMITTANWLLTIAIALLVYGVRQTLTLALGSTACAKSFEEAVVVAVVGLALCFLTWLTIQDFNAHMYRNWFRATRCKHLVSDLYLLVAEAGTPAPVWKWNQEEGWPENLRYYEKFQVESAQLGSRAAQILTMYRTLVWGLGLAFVAIFFLALMLPACPPAAVKL